MYVQVMSRTEFGGRRYRIIDRNYTLEWSKVLCRREVLLSDSIKKAPVDSQGRRSGERLIEQPWLQLMCCALVSGHEVVMYFGVMEVIKTEVLGRQVEGVGVDKERLGPDDINLQTEELHCNYSVLIGSLE